MYQDLNEYELSINCNKFIKTSPFVEHNEKRYHTLSAVGWIG